MAVPLVNGRAYDYVSITMLILNIPVVGVTAINYEETQDKVNNFGTGNNAVSRGHGAKDGTGSFDISMNETEAIRAAASSRSLLDIPLFDVILVFANAGSVVRTHVIKNVEFTNDPGGGAQGDTDLVGTFNIVFSHVVRT